MGSATAGLDTLATLEWTLAHERHRRARDGEPERVTVQDMTLPGKKGRGDLEHQLTGRPGAWLAARIQYAEGIGLPWGPQSS